jgi:hypothetical protein
VRRKGTKVGQRHRHQERGGNPVTDGIADHHAQFVPSKPNEIVEITPDSHRWGGMGSDLKPRQFWHGLGQHSHLDLPRLIEVLHEVWMVRSLICVHLFFLSF